MKTGRRTKTMNRILIGLGIVLLLAMLIMIPPVGAWVASTTGKAESVVRSWAQTVAGIALGAILVTWGIAALSLPLLGGIMIVAGLALLAYSVYPLFSSSSTSMS